jgi:hypothetical protein
MENRNKRTVFCSIIAKLRTITLFPRGEGTAGGWPSKGKQRFSGNFFRPQPSVKSVDIQLLAAISVNGFQNRRTSPNKKSEKKVAFTKAE